jgi:hypothetical protein
MPLAGASGFILLRTHPALKNRLQCSRTGAKIAKKDKAENFRTQVLEVFLGCLCVFGTRCN